MLVYVLKQNGQPFMPTARFGKIRRLLKAKKAKVVRREPFTIKLLSSQLCHACGTLHPEMKDLKIRIMRCDCGLVIGRDQNAAINILNEGLRILAAQ